MATKEVLTEEGNHVLIPEHVKNMVGSPQKLLEYMHQVNTVDAIEPVTWELTGFIMEHLKEHENVPEDMPVYRDCLEKIAEFSDAKNLILGILEHFDPSTQATHVELLMPALSTVLKRIAQDDIKACASVLETTYITLSYYIDSLNIPNYDTYQPGEPNRNSFELDKIRNFLDGFISILRPCIDNICLTDHKDVNFSSFRNHTFRFISNSLVTLGQLDLDISEVTESDAIDKIGNYKNLDQEGSRIPLDAKNGSKKSMVLKVCYDLMSLSAVFYSPTQLYNNTSWFDLQPVEEQSEEGQVETRKQVERARACYAFLLFPRRLLYDRFPKVYSVQHLLVGNVLSLHILLSCKNQAVVWKGVELLSFVMNRMPDSSLCMSEILYYIVRSYSESQVEVFTEDAIKTIFNHLVNIATMLPSRKIRSNSVKLLSLLLDKFSWSDKYLLITYLLKKVEHTGVLGVIIGYVKDILDAVLRKDPPIGSIIFCDAKKLFALGELIFRLPDGTETDLLANSDRIMPALNLLRFLLIRDQDNRTSIKNHTTKIEKDFLKPLRTALDLSRAHYTNELRSYGKRRPTQDQNASREPEFTVNGMPLPSIPKLEQKKTLEAALHSFDIMEIVAVRVGELLG